MGFQQGLSGLNAASKNLEVIGNNVANASTVGFKSSKAEFSDVFANSLTGAGTSQIGIGVKIGAVEQQFTQGNVSASNNPLDIAINGGGFFRMSHNGTIDYARNGQFQLDKNGYIVNTAGSRLTGYASDNKGVLATGAPVDLQIKTDDLQPKTTTQVNSVMNFDSREPVIAIPFDSTNPLSYSNSTAVQVYDSLGNPHSVQSYFVKSAPNTWDVYTAADGKPIGYVPPAPAVKTTTLSFKNDGSLDTALSPQPYTVSVPSTTGSATPFPVKFNATGTTQFGATFGVTTLNQDGYTSGKLAGFSAGADGKIVGRYTNGQSNVLGQVVLANFTNPNGLQSLGNNEWAETSDSGTPLVGAPQSGGLGVLQSSAVEESNVDLTASLVEMITAQRVYQANAQTIKTEDQILQTLVNLR